MRRGRGVAAAAVGAALLFAAPALGASKNVELLDNLPEATDATAINFLQYKSKQPGTRVPKRLDVMLVTGRFGLKSYSLEDPAHPEFLDEVTADELRLPGDPPVDFSSDPKSTFWQNEDMDVDQRRKLALISRDPRAYKGSTSREPGDPDPNGATNIAGVYVVSAANPAKLRVLSFQQLPTGHTTTCVNRCRALWTGGPASTDQDKAELGWTFGRPIIVTDLANPKKPKAYPMRPVDLFRRDGVTAYSHDVQVDAMGLAWVSGVGGTRGYWTEGRHRDPVTGRVRQATAVNPIPYAGGGLQQAITNDETGGFEHNAWRPVGQDAPTSDPRYAAGELLLVTEEDFGPPQEYCSKQGMFSINSLEGSFGGEAWKSTPENKFRLTVVGTWNPFEKEGSRPVGDYGPGDEFCSAHYFDVDGATVTYAWYAEGTRFLDISDPANPTQFAYWRPDDGNVWASYLHNGFIYTADQARGVDVLRLTAGARAARRSGKEVVAPRSNARHRAFVRGLAARYKADPATAGLCLLPTV